MTSLLTLTLLAHAGLSDATVASIVTLDRSNHAPNYPLRPEEARVVGEAVVEASARFSVPPEVILSVIEQESGYLGRENKSGAAGVMQIKPTTAQDFCPLDECHPEIVRENVLAGTSYLAYLKFRFNSWAAALTAYNAGPTTFLRSKKKLNSYAITVVRRAKVIKAMLRRRSSPSW